MNILADGTLIDLGLYFKPPFFNLSFYDGESTSQLNAKLKNQDILLCRSTLTVNETLLKDCSLQYVATASSGSNHLDKDYLDKNNIRWIDAKGANRHAVADYVLSVFAYLNITTEKKVGIMGMGHVGGQLATYLKSFGFSIIPYDPPKAAGDSSFHSASFNEFAQADVLCIHANLHNTKPHPTEGALSHDFFKALKPGTILINASRGGIVDESALLANPQPLTYCTDVYDNEPNISARIVEKATLCTPHIAGHSIEAKRRATFQVAQALHKALGFETLTLPKTLSLSEKSFFNAGWQDFIGRLYNPLHETRTLKEASELEATFLTLRTKHVNRHDFGVYHHLEPTQCLF